MAKLLSPAFQWMWVSILDDTIPPPSKLYLTWGFSTVLFLLQWWSGWSETCHAAGQHQVPGDVWKVWMWGWGGGGVRGDGRRRGGRRWGEQGRGSNRWSEITSDACPFDYCTSLFRSPRIETSDILLISLLVHHFFTGVEDGGEC